MYFDQKDFGARIAELRKMFGMTQEDLAAKLNISTNHLGYMERGQHGISIDLVIEMAVFFNVSTDYLLMGKDRDRVTERKQILSVIEELSVIARTL